MEMEASDEVIESTKILSDSESIDGLCDSDEDDYYEDEGEGFELRHNKDLNTSDTDSDDDDEPLSERQENLDGIWEKKRRKTDDVPFFKTSGPNIPDLCKTPLQIFLCLFPEDLIDEISMNTNLYSTQLGKSFQPTTSDEIKTFIGINVLMGVKRLPSYRDYWSGNEMLKDKYLSQLMTVNRFGFLLSHLHLNDNSQMPKKGEPGFDKLYKIRPLLNKLSETFKRCWNPNKFQSIDEAMIKFKGRSSIKQYMPMKPIKRGYKTWIRADESGYVCEFQVYTGKIENSTEKALGSRVVKDLTRELVGGNHHVYFDNYFTSVDLVTTLKEEQIFACGTVRSNRADLPKEQKRDKDMTRGEFEYRSSHKGISWLKWKDNRVVSLLSNSHDPSLASHINRRTKDGKLTQIVCPEMVQDYNRHMGYVDRADMLKSTYEIDRKSKKWWHRIFWHFVDVSVTNAFIIYSKINGDKQILKLKDFRLQLVAGLVRTAFTPKRGRRPNPVIHSRAKPQISKEKRRTANLHMPMAIDENRQRRCAHCSTKTEVRRTRWLCSTCEIPLCTQLERNCFAAFHA